MLQNVRELRKNSNSIRQAGFTIIEIMIVLAIAGVIMGIVFLAIPALQRNNRNTQRKTDVGALIGAVNEYTSNNSGAMPNSAAQLTAVVDSAKLSIYDATGTKVQITGADSTPGAANTFGICRVGATAAAGVCTDPVNNNNGINAVTIVTNAKCSTGGSATSTGATTKQFAILFAVETTSGNTKQCLDS